MMLELDDVEQTSLVGRDRGGGGGGGGTAFDSHMHTLQ